MATAETIRVRLNWDRTALAYKLPRFNEVHIGPEPGAPFGRKGRQILGAWCQVATRQTAGMVILDGDVAIDPCDLAAMNAAIADWPEAVHVAPVRNWYTSTGRDIWEWGHWPWGESPGQDMRTPGRFSFGFTYLPRVMFTRGRGPEGWDSWRYPWCDRNASRLALQLGLDVVLVPGCWPRHTHF